MCALQKQYDFFKRNMSSLLEDYDGKYLVIPESLEVKAFDTISEAYVYGAKTYGLGKFLRSSPMPRKSLICNLKRQKSIHLRFLRELFYFHLFSFRNCLIDRRTLI